MEQNLYDDDDVIYDRWCFPADSFETFIMSRSHFSAFLLQHYEPENFKYNYNDYLNSFFLRESLHEAISFLRFLDQELKEVLPWWRNLR